MEQIINNNNDEIIKPHEQPFLDDITKNGRFILSIGSKGSGKTFLMMSAGVPAASSAASRPALRL